MVRINNRTTTRNTRTARRSNKGDAVATYASDAWSLAKRTAVGLNEIRKLINVEHKFIDTNTTVAVSQTGSTQYLTPVGQGDNISDREGDSIKVQSFEISGAIRRSTIAAATVTDAVRIIVVRDLQNQGALPLASDVLETIGTATAPYQPLDFLLGLDLNKRFTIVYDELFCLDISNQIKIFSFRTNHDCHTFFRGTTSAVTDAGNGSYFVITVSNSTTTNPTVDYTTRVRFTDN